MEFLAHTYVILTSLAFTILLLTLATLYLVEAYQKVRRQPTPTDIVNREFETITRQ